MTFQQNIQNSAQKQGMSLSSVYVITLVAYAAFAIPVTIIAFDAAWFAGVAVAICVAGLWPKMPKALTKPAPAVEVAQVAPSADTGRRSSGNASFDAYRDDMLARLEQEQDDFEVFLERLRAAKDATEFDNFMDERVKRLTKAPIAHPQT